MLNTFRWTALIAAIVLVIAVAGAAISLQPPLEPSQPQAAEKNQKEQTDEKNNRTLWDRLFPDSISIYTLLLAIFTALLATAGVYQIKLLVRAEHIATKSANAAKNAADAAKQSAESIPTVERAYLYLAGKTELFGDAVTPPGQPPEVPLPNRTIIYQFRNYGKTPAVIDALAVEANIRDIPPTRDELKMMPLRKFAGELIVSAGDFSIKPGHRLFLSDNDFSSIIAGQKNLCFYGRVGYSDVFGKIHEYGFGVVYEHSTKTFMATGEPKELNYQE